MITVFGSINIDLITRVPRIVGAGETVIGDTYEQAPGGKGANQALAARRAGAQVRLFGAVGDDAFADAALANLREAGVDLSGVRRTDQPTGAAFISVDAAGSNAITVAAGANAAADAAALERLDLNSRDILLLQREIPDREGEAAARTASASGACVILNCAPSGAISSSYLGSVGILILNEHEAAELASGFGIGTGSASELAQALHIRFGVTVVVTLGSAGALGWSDGIAHRVEAWPVEAVDTTGAGDTFVGVFAAFLSEGAPFHEALRSAAAAGSLACRRSGAQAGIPMRRDIDTAMVEQQLRR